MFDTDGSVIPNIATRDYLITYAPTKLHQKIRGAQITISAPSEFDAREYAEHTIRLACMVVANIEAL